MSRQKANHLIILPYREYFYMISCVTFNNFFLFLAEIGFHSIVLHTEAELKKWGKKIKPQASFLCSSSIPPVFIRDFFPTAGQLFRQQDEMMEAHCKQTGYSSVSQPSAPSADLSTAVFRRGRSFLLPGQLSSATLSTFSFLY